MEIISKELSEALGKWKCHHLEPLFNIGPVPELFHSVLPADYIAAISQYGGCEGFLGTQYMRLYRLEELLSLNTAYMVPNYAPEILIFGSDGGGEAFAFSIEGQGVVQVPFIPLTMQYAGTHGSSFTEFIITLAASGESDESSQDGLGKEIHAIQPLVFGGDPQDPKNRVLVEPRKHAEIACFWNKVFRDKTGG